MSIEIEKPRTQLLLAGAVFAASLCLATIFNLIARGTYDFDEFVYLLLGHAVNRGRIPYQDFLFYHPPGIVMVMGVLDPLVQRWWVVGRIPSLLLDAGTCALVFLVARRFLSRAGAITAGLLCACSPIMLVTGTRIIPDDYVMFFTFLAIYLLMVKPTYLFAILAGVAFGIAIVFKYPAVLLLPAAVLVAGKRRWPVFLAATGIMTMLLLAPFLSNLHALYEDTVVFQGNRFQYPLELRALSILLYAILLQPLGFMGLWVRPARWWLLAGYLSAFAYLGSSQVYYHYMVPIIPFASILGAIYLTSLQRVNLARLLPAVGAGAVALTVIWASAMEFTPGYTPFRITSAQAASLTPVIHYIEARTSHATVILDDRPDLPLLAYRHNCDDYFWNDSQVLNAQQLMPCLITQPYVIHFYSGGNGFPIGFLERIDADYCKKVVGSGPHGAFVYNLRCLSPPIPLRN